MERTSCKMQICIPLHILKKKNINRVKKCLKYILTLNTTCNITLRAKSANVTRKLQITITYKCKNLLQNITKSNPTICKKLSPYD